MAAGAVLVGGGAFAATLPGERFAPAAPAGRAAPEATASTGHGPLPAPLVPPAPGAPVTASPSVAPPVAAPSSPASSPPGEATPSPSRSPVVRNYEAEHAELSGFVQIFPLSEASGGAVVGSIGRHRDSHVRFVDVQVDHAGEYEVTIYYVTPQDRTASLVVNDDEPVVIEFRGLDTGREVGELSVTVTLESGVNELWFGNPGGLAPSLDRITVTG